MGVTYYINIKPMGYLYAQILPSVREATTPIIMKNILNMYEICMKKYKNEAIWWGKKPAKPLLGSERQYTSSMGQA